jgi:hypothetical protein
LPPSWTSGLVPSGIPKAGRTSTGKPDRYGVNADGRQESSKPEPFFGFTRFSSSFRLANLQDMDGPGELAGAPPAAAEYRANYDKVPPGIPKLIIAELWRSKRGLLP